MLEHAEIAQDLRGAINSLDPERPLKTDKQLEAYFVPRPFSPVEDVRILLQDTQSPQKILFTGHRGSGKSTELAWLTRSLREQFFVIQYSVKDRLNIFDLTHLDIVLSLALEMVERAREEGIEVSERVQEHILKFTKDISQEVVSEVTAGGGVSAELNVIVAKLSSKLGAEEVTRTSVREKVSHRLSDLFENIDLLAREIEKSTGRRLLAIVEDLDKTDLETTKKLFYENAVSLSAPRLSVIYTFPMALRHDNDFMQIRASFPRLYVLPNFMPRNRDGGENEDCIDALQAIFTKRAAPHLIDANALRRLALSSSGIPREFVAIAQTSCLEARKAEREFVDETCVETAIANRTREYDVLLTPEQRELLKKVRENKRITNDKDHRSLLHNLSALEYRNSGVWYDVHPVVAPLLDRE